MAVQKILFPYNFTTHEGKALNFVIKTFIGKSDIKITLFHTYLPLPEIDMSANPEMRKMRGGLVTLAEELKEKEAGLKATKEFLVQKGFTEDQVDYAFQKRKKTVADEIVEYAEKGHYDVLVLSPQPGKVTRLFTRSVHSRALSVLKNITICIAA